MSKALVAIKKFPKKLITIKVAANLLGLSPSTLRHWDKNGKLPSIRNFSHYRLYRLSDLLKMIRADEKLGRIKPKKKLLVDG
ncbi:MAG: MerR family DNA-binding transcriptional regulator [Candidatus Paceibacterota bacterium]|jgi:excisionase family DNA binding protein